MTDESRKCAECGKPFPVNPRAPRQKFCSRDCSKKAKCKSQSGEIEYDWTLDMNTFTWKNVNTGETETGEE